MSRWHVWVIWIRRESIEDPTQNVSITEDQYGAVGVDLPDRKWMPGISMVVSLPPLWPQLPSTPTPDWKALTLNLATHQLAHFLDYWFKHGTGILQASN